MDTVDYLAGLARTPGTHTVPAADGTLYELRVSYDRLWLVINGVNRQAADSVVARLEAALGTRFTIDDFGATTGPFVYTGKAPGVSS